MKRPFSRTAQDAHLIKYGVPPVRCGDGCGVMEAAEDVTGPILACQNPQCGWVMEANEFSMQEWESTRAWNNR